MKLGRTDLLRYCRDHIEDLRMQEACNSIRPNISESLSAFEDYLETRPRAKHIRKAMLAHAKTIEGKHPYLAELLVFGAGSDHDEP